MRKAGVGPGEGPWRLLVAHCLSLRGLRISSYNPSLYPSFGFGWPQPTEYLRCTFSQRQACGGGMFPCPICVFFVQLTASPLHSHHLIVSKKSESRSQTYQDRDVSEQDSCGTDSFSPGSSVWRLVESTTRLPEHQEV